ncbi:hypothetical protein M9Y10_004877 [Tritrichomonas musculus]|uniref:Uncharacterized protein n=1 Tax=Tritrichomonas musculus TaxID=1915356 RepID=A0ABR2JJS1_9EUKA
MIWILTLFSQIWLGIELFLPLLYQELSLYSIVSAGCLLGISISTFIFFFSSYFFGFNLIHLIVHTICLDIFNFYLNQRRRKTYDYTFKENFLTFFSPIVVSLVSFIFIFPLFLSTYGSFLASIMPSIHEEFSLRASFLYGVNKHRNHLFLIEHPDYSGQFIVSRWLTSYHMSMLNIGFGGFRTVLIFTTTIYVISYFLFLISICIDFRLHFFACPFVIALPVFISGFGFFDFLKNCEKYNLCDSKETNIDYISYFGKGFDHNLYLNPILHIVIGNIPMLFSLSLSSLSLLLIYRSICCRTSCSLLKVNGFIVGGILPSVMHQSFFAMFVISTLNCLFQLWRQKRNYIKQCKCFFSTFFISFIFLNLVRYTNFNYLKNCFIFDRQYSQNIERGDSFPFFKYWYDAFGFYLFIIFGLSWFVFSIIEKQFTFILFVTFIIFNYWQTQTSKVENLFTFYSFLFTFGCAIYMATAQRICFYWSIAEFRGIFTGIFSVVTLLCCISGIIGIGQQILIWDTPWDEDRIRLSNWILKNTNEKSIFLSKRGFLDPVVSLCGRSQFITNDYLAMKENIDIKKRKDELFHFIGDSNSENLLENVDYIVVWKDDLLLSRIQFNNSNWRLVYREDDVRVYNHIK